MGKIADAELRQIRELSLDQTLRCMERAGLVFGFSEDQLFVPVKNQGTRRFHVTMPSGYVAELIVTDCPSFKWYEPRSRLGGGGSIDLLMKLCELDFKRAVHILKP